MAVSEQSGKTGIGSDMERTAIYGLSVAVEVAGEDDGVIVTDRVPRLAFRRAKREIVLHLEVLTGIAVPAVDRCGQRAHVGLVGDQIGRILGPETARVDGIGPFVGRFADGGDLAGRERSAGLCGVVLLVHDDLQLLARQRRILSQTEVDYGPVVGHRNIELIAVKCGACMRVGHDGCVARQVERGADVQGGRSVLHLKVQRSDGGFPCGQRKIEPQEGQQRPEDEVRLRILILGQKARN